MKPIVVALILLGLTSCSAKENISDQTFVKTLNSSFERLYLVKFEKDFPANKEHLTRCIEKQYEPCFKVLSSVSIARDNIVALPSEMALEKTLNIISTACKSEDPHQANYICYGALISLYLYSNSEEDKLILENLKGMDKAIQSLIFNGEFSWFTNRPNRAEWKAYISSAPIDWSYEGSKAAILEAFSSDAVEPLWLKPLWLKQ